MEYNDNDIVRFESSIIKCKDTACKRMYDLKFKGSCGSKYENKEELSQLIVKEGIEVINKNLDYSIKCSLESISFLQSHDNYIAEDITNNIKEKYNIELGMLNIIIFTTNLEDLPDEIVYKFCPNCGIKVQVGKFCPNCGEKLENK